MKTNSYTQINERDIRECKYCGADIAWHQNARGKWFPVDVYYHAGIPVKVSGIGNQHNLTPWHKCNKERKVSHMYPLKAFFVQFESGFPSSRAQTQINKTLANPQIQSMGLTESNFIQDKAVTL